MCDYYNIVAALDLFFFFDFLDGAQADPIMQRYSVLSDCVCVWGMRGSVALKARGKPRVLHAAVARTAGDILLRTCVNVMSFRFEI